MALTVTIQEQLPIGKVTHELNFVVQDERLSVHELIRERVEQKAALHNLSLSTKIKDPTITWQTNRMN